MKKILILLLSMASFAAYAQGPNSFGGVALRVNDTTTYQTNAAAFHTAGYYDIYFNNQATNDHWDVWNGSSYDHIFAFGQGSGTISDAVYGSGWNGVTTIAPSKNAVYDKIEAIGSVIGAQDLFISGPALYPGVTNPPDAASAFEVGSNTFMAMDFDQTTGENAFFQVTLPRNWNNGTVKFTVYWTATAGSGTVQWDISGAAYSDDDALSGALGTIIEIDDTLIATSDLHKTAQSSAMTFAGSPADADFLLLKISRDPSEDTLTGDAKLLGVLVTLTLDAAVSE